MTPALLSEAPRISLRMLPIGRIYLIEVDHRNGSYFAESDHITRGKNCSEREGLAALRQHDNAIAIWECNPSEGTMRDVSEDMARMWLRDLIEDGFNPEEDVWPDFISRHVSNDSAMREYADKMPGIFGIRGVA